MFQEMKEQGGRHAANAAIEKPRLPDITRAFVQRAFADGVVEQIDERKKQETEKLDKRKNFGKGEDWERKKWLLVRYVVDDQLTLDEVKKYAGATSPTGAKLLYTAALEEIWEASPKELRRKFPRRKIVVGKSRIYERTPEIRAKTSASLNRPEVKAKLSAVSRGKKLSEEHKFKIGAANKGRKRSEEAKNRISTSQRERYRRKKQEERLIFLDKNK
jgi:hypothetical protein